MKQLYSWPWVEAQVAQTIEIWNGSAARPAQGGPQYSLREHKKRESAYDEALRAVEWEVRKAPRTKTERIETQDRIIASFVRFSADALDLEGEAGKLLTNDFLPVGTQLARWARQFDASLSTADIMQACRNAWTACGLQSLLGDRMGITPSILGYSLLYPYTDNFLDREDVSVEAKLRFSRRFRSRLRGEALSAQDDREAAVWTLVSLIEEQYPRAIYPQVFDCLLAIHQAQEESIAQMRSCDDSDTDVLRITFAKGGSSVLADACLAHGFLGEEESQFSFEWGVLLQLADDLQDVGEDIRSGSVTLFSRAAALGMSLDDLVIQLLGFSERVGALMERLPSSTETLNGLLRMSWRSLIVGAVAESHEFFSPGFIDEVECCSPFRLEFLRTRREKLANRHRLSENLFNIFLEIREGDDGEHPLPDYRQRQCIS